MNELEVSFQKHYFFTNTEKPVRMFLHSNQFRLPKKKHELFSNTLTAYKPEVRILGIYITEISKCNVHLRSLR
jgi:hypothetical protein